MSKQIEALKLALECIEAWGRGCDRDHYWRDIEAATNAIREALADSALERMAQNERELGIQMEPPCKTGSQCTSKCQQCEQPAQHQPNIESYLEKDNLQPAQQQEPFGYFRPEPFGWTDCAEKDEGAIALYEQPPASKPWVGLTEFDIDQIPYGCSHADSRLIAYAIEAKLREKNAQPSKPLTDEQIIQLAQEWPAETNDWASHIDFARAIEQAHGITGETK